MRKTLSLLFIVTILFCSACKDKIKPGNVQPERKEVSGVLITTVASSAVDVFYETSGTVEAKNISTISSRLMGTVMKIIVKEGDKVNRGDILLIIDDSDVAQKMTAAEAGYKEAQKAFEISKKNRSLADITYRRYAKLREEQVISQQEFDQIETQKKIADIEYERSQQAVERAKAMQEETRVYHGFTRIKAPYTGLITAKKIDEGTMAVPGMPLLVMEDTSQYKIRISVDERLYKNISIGMPVSVLVLSTNDMKQGRITRITPAVDPTTRTFNVEVLVKGIPLRSGLYAKVFIPEGKKKTILVPNKAIVQKGQLRGVYSVNDKGVISYSLIKTGKFYGERTEVLSGLKDDDRIIVEGVEKAVDGGITKQ
ncbi:MAG: Multidrug resistance protein MdtE precursor [Syntrophorhabdus sp. PtaU1.Bin058]|nr:MAG: Multidrug resistance protein MdtE precursor [Syntrophorhabdus sp. PtaU1.Bin058]